MTEDPDQSLHVVKGDPTPEELAAVVAVGSAKAAAAGEPARPSNWAAYWRSVREPLRPGRGAWRASGLPR